MGYFYTINAFKRPSSTLLVLQIGGKTGKSRFIATNIRTRQQMEIPLTPVATAEILKELDDKCWWSSAGRVLQTVMVSDEMKDFINACWNELKKEKPEFCIK